MRTLILGGGGQLASALVRAAPGDQIHAYAHRELDIRDSTPLKEVFLEHKPQAVINTAAYTNVDQAEEDLITAFQVNGFAVRQMARLCQEIGCFFVQISTDYVFEGQNDNPYVEEDRPGPLSVYGMSKLVGEYFARNECQNHLIIRTSGLFGFLEDNHLGKNFVEAILKRIKKDQLLRVVGDQVFSPTYTKDLAYVIWSLLERKAAGVYHATNQGACSWYDFAVEICELMGAQTAVQRVSSEEYERKAERPAYSVLSTQKLNTKLDYSTRHWKQALQDYLVTRADLKGK